MYKIKSKITVLMPVFNCEKFLSEAIESILSQTYKDFEFLIINDGSTDRSSEIIKSYTDSRINIIKNIENKGFTYSLNMGIKRARGEYIARMDSDDISMPNRLQTQLNYLDNHPDIGILGSDIEFIGPEGAKLTDIEPPTLPTSSVLIHWTLFFRCCLNHPSVMIRKSLLEKLSGYDSSIPYAQDYDLWMRSAAITKIKNLPEPLVKIRKHSGNISLLHGSEQKHIGVRIAKREIIEKYCLSPTEMEVKFLQYPGTIKKRTDSIKVTGLIYKLYGSFISKNNIRLPDHLKIQLHAFSTIGKIISNHCRKNFHNFLFLIRDLSVIDPKLLISVPSFSFLKILQSILDGLKKHRFIFKLTSLITEKRRAASR